MYWRMRNTPTAGVNTHPDDPAMLSSRDEGLLFFYYYLSTRYGRAAVAARVGRLPLLAKTAITNPTSWTLSLFVVRG